MANLVSGRSGTVDASRFSMVPRTDVPRSAFDVEHIHKTTFDAGLLIPVYVDEVLPGDSHRVRMSAFARLATPITPVMDNLYLESFFFFVPNRLVWEHWRQFMGEQDSPSDTTDYLIPQRVIDADGELYGGSLFDYFGITMNSPTPPSGIFPEVNALPFRGYALIWNEFFRDQDLDDPLVIDRSDGPDTTQLGPVNDGLVRRRKRHDYFTSARPWPVKPTAATGFGPAPLDPTSGGMVRPEAGAPVMGLGVRSGATHAGVPLTNALVSGGRVDTFPDWFDDSVSNPLLTRADQAGPDIRVLINDIRTANMVQLLLERNARGGSRYTEIVRSHFGVMSPDSRLQRPEYLGGGRTLVTVNPVAQLSATGITGSTTVLGELSGVGTAMVQNHGFTASFTEHGYVIGLVCVRADLTYQQGINRMWHRRTMYDFYWPALAHLGEQAVLSKEIYADGSAADDDVFGYQERWSEYKYAPSRVSGRFRTFHTNPLDIWHFGQHFLSRPVLGSVFLQEFPPVDRVLQVGGLQNEQFLMDALFEARKVRPMPMFSIPGLGPRL